MTDFLTAIPAHVKSKTVDKDWSKTFVFEEIPCNHGPEAKAFEKVDCPKCQYDVAELDIEAKLTAQDANETIEDNSSGSPVTRTLSKIVIKRGKYDDAIGIEKHFT